MFEGLRSFVLLQLGLKLHFEILIGFSESFQLIQIAGGAWFRLRAGIDLAKQFQDVGEELFDFFRDARRMLA